MVTGMWLFSGWDQATPCKPCAVVNPSADTIRVDASTLRKNAEDPHSPLTAAVPEVWATRFPHDFDPQRNVAHHAVVDVHRTQELHPHPVKPRQPVEKIPTPMGTSKEQRVQPGLSLHESSEVSEEEIPGSEALSPDNKGCGVAQRRLKGIKGQAEKTVGAALGWLGLSEIALEYPYEDLAAATNGFAKEHRLGAGGVGAVYQGKLRNVTEVAIKVLADMGGVEGFEDEVRVLSRFRHPHLVTLMGFGQREGQKYLVYELMPGGDVEVKLRQSRSWLEQVQKAGRGDLTQAPFPWQQRLHVALGAAKGLAHMVGSTPKTFHRDIKPANILLDADGTPKMADFGLAATVKDNSGEDKLAVEQIAGTPGYTCLTYIRSRQVTEESEVYSFGIVLLELLINRPPALASAHGDMVFPILEAVQPYVGGAHGRLMQCLDPAAGWPRQLAEELGDLALACLDPVTERRPAFNSVVRSLARLTMLRPRGSFAVQEHGAEGSPGKGGSSPSDGSASPEGKTAVAFGWSSWWH